MELKQIASLKPYIKLNSEFQKQADRETNEQITKFKNNAIFGKSTENPMNRFDVNIVTNRKKYIKRSVRLSFKR